MYQVQYSGITVSVTSSTTTITFTAPSLPDGVFTGTVVVLVTAVNRLGIGPASDPATAEIRGMLCYEGDWVAELLHLSHPSTFT